MNSWCCTMTKLKAARKQEERKGDKDKRQGGKTSEYWTKSRRDINNCSLQEKRRSST